MKTIIYTQRVETIESYGERRDCADQRIAEFIRICGYLPIPIPNNPKLVKDIMDVLNPDGIILVGGNSLVKYGGNAPERDETDKRLIEMSIDKRIPLYGFCRGMQSILDYFGNDLIRVPNHVAVRHAVFGEEETTLVNSYHNEACVELKSNEIKCVMRGEDGVIEKIKHKSLPVVGTMWHPERENPFREGDILFIKKFMGDIEE
ncbi:MAG: C26 family cysteine hydrolase domain-containing family [Lachnospiraceae bacterium]|nr:C26 family cysteine hydrolase domain-containing family [Lachnospiraceae bacterium]